jgi:hypothetical protein
MPQDGPEAMPSGPTPGKPTRVIVALDVGGPVVVAGSPFACDRPSHIKHGAWQVKPNTQPTSEPSTSGGTHGAPPAATTSGSPQARLPLSPAPGAHIGPVPPAATVAASTPNSNPSPDDDDDDDDDAAARMASATSTRSGALGCARLAGR